MAKKLKQFKFTLIEITVAFGIFAILIMVLMQFLSTVQSVWNFSEKRSRAYADKLAFEYFIDRAVAAAKGGITANNKQLQIKNCLKPGTDIFSDFDIVFASNEKYDTSDDGYLKPIEISASDREKMYGAIVVKSGSEEELISNVVRFKCSKYSNILNFNLEMFGSEEDFRIWRDMNDADKQLAYFKEHGFVFNFAIIIPE